ncbi:DUF3012 domain-containing protein [Vibrio cholerae]|nr:DUF3012 domain-containing protein [Vibrio cholerae]ORP13551.1 hypothetical protein B7978_09805 [Vibrio cholerae]RBO16352.1 DUF3012 domain-containing protein [Vibrio cholerae]TQQ01656.1 DUF3012 domain-containing protein [Vibrio cholerae]TXY50157.1 DUF3012 domain-containing protein [Vibrio cholerae]
MAGSTQCTPLASTFTKLPPAFRVNSAPASTTIFATLLSEISLPASTTIFIESKGDWTAKEAGSYAKYCVL